MDDESEPIGCPNCGAEGSTPHWVYCPTREADYTLVMTARRVATLTPITPEMTAKHEAHSAKGENHWFTCFLCDDEAED